MREAKGVIFLLALYFFSIFIYKMKIFKKSIKNKHEINMKEKIKIFCSK